jgi:hypothetical protein
MPGRIEIEAVVWRNLRRLPRRPRHGAEQADGATPAQSKPAARARPADAEQSAGLWSPAALGVTCSCAGTVDLGDDVCCGLRRRQASRAKCGVWGATPSFFCRRHYAREPRAAAKASGRSPWGDHKAQWGEFITKVRVAHTLLVDPKCNVGSNSLGV